MSQTVFSVAFSIFNYLAISLGSICLIFAGTYLYTYFRFKHDLHRFQNTTGKSLPAPQIPTVIPWIGIAPSFLTTKPLAFWARLFEWYPRAAGACILTMGGQTANVIFNVPATQYIMRDRKLGRENFNEIVIINGMGVSPEDYEKMHGFLTPPKPGELSGSAQQVKVHAEYLLKTEHVNELTQEFMNAMKRQIAEEFQDGPGEVNLYEWLRTLMFTASTTAGWGERVMQVIPDLEQLFYQYDSDMLSMFYGLPRFLISRKVANRDRIINELARWYEMAEKETGGVIADPTTVAWEPIYGSRVARARHLLFRRRGLSRRGMAGLELGFLFGLSSNAIPATGWMVFYILDSKRSTQKPTLYDHVMRELEASKNKDGSLNVPTLVSQPILQSTLHEVLRMYVDTLVSRQIPHDMTLPLSPEKSASPRSLQLKANTLLMMPSYPAHTDPETWQSAEFPHHPPATEFYPYRFLTADPSTATPQAPPVFTTTHTTGRFFPFGGGKTICPGRVFAKQEILASVATWLATFDMDVVHYVDAQRRPTDVFPVLRESLPGSALMVPGGDMRVRVQRKTG